MQTFHAYGDTSERFVEICDGIDITTFTNPSAPVTAPINWTTAGYADGEALDGKDNTLPSLTYTAVDSNGDFIDIWQGGAAVAANDLPFIFKSAAPTVALFIANAAREIGLTFTVIITYTKPNGEDTILKKWDGKII